MTIVNDRLNSFDHKEAIKNFPKPKLHEQKFIVTF